MIVLTIHLDVISWLFLVYVFFFFKQKTAYEIMPSLVGSEMCIRDSLQYMAKQLRSNQSEIHILKPTCDQFEYNDYLDFIDSHAPINNPSQVFDFNLSKESISGIKNYGFQAQNNVVEALEDCDIEFTVSVLNLLKKLDEYKLSNIHEYYRTCQSKVSQYFQNNLDNVLQTIKANLEKGNLITDLTIRQLNSFKQECEVLSLIHI
eukprot:TRINITY_DN13419_c0_g1_i1.p2 TRINITY_DN13419_c0_g1~~TRINITY_DN13419_c0_g1_i1.p2  ORF type:complete len:205 (-),score=30.85 TRINITY_DN13419_c0_g1_i1:113-727(-)